MTRLSHYEYEMAWNNKKGEKRMKNMKKTILAIMMVLVLLLSAIPVGLADDGYGEWIAYCYTVTEYALQVTKTPEEFRPWLLNRNFPMSVLRNVIYECQSWRGIPVNALAIDLSGGVNLRSTPDYYVNNNIVRKVHGDETVYVYFRLYSQYGKEWYYGVTSAGVEGFMYAERIQLAYN